MQGLETACASQTLFSAAAPLAEVENVADQTPGVEAVSADKSELRRTLRAISELPTSLREPLVLRTIDEHSQADTAKILGITEKAVEARVRRARARLAEKLKKL
jgi:RNA polymerase sigma-70 factor (ECF subfamily)